MRNILLKILDIYVLSVKIDKNHRKTCKLFTVWFTKEFVDIHIFLVLTGSVTKIFQISILIFLDRHSMDFQNFGI